MRIRKGVAAIIFVNERKGKRYLLLKRKLHWKGWEWLKGGSKKGESELNCLKREIKEETGKNKEEYKIKSTGKQHTFLYERSFIHDKIEWNGAKNKVFFVEFKDKKIKADKREHSGYGWFNKNEMIRKIRWKDQKILLRKLLN